METDEFMRTPLMLSRILAFEWEILSDFAPIHRNQAPKLDSTFQKTGVDDAHWRPQRDQEQ
jgi:hypothetical protein